MPILRRSLLAASTALLASVAFADDQPGSTVSDGSQAWYTFAGQLNAQKYATAEQITPANVARLSVAFTFSTATTHGYEAPPLVVNGTMYLITPSISFREWKRARVRPPQARMISDSSWATAWW